MRIAPDLSGTLIKIGFFEDGRTEGFLPIPVHLEDCDSSVLLGLKDTLEEGT